MDDFVLERIVRILLLHTSSIANIGFFNGKMGIALFLYKYSLFSSKEFYKKFADELIDEIYDEVNIDSSLNFSDGLAGIAWCIEFLIHHRFVLGDRDELVEDLDRQILQYDIRKLDDASLDKGLKGLAYYVLARYHQRWGEHPIINIPYVTDLLDAINHQNILSNDQEILYLKTELNNVLMDCNCKLNFDRFLMLKFVDNQNYNKKLLFDKKQLLGLNGGLAGLGLKMINASK